ncbi:hypothetical protein LC609_14245, partial [Nostoc sp. XA013]|nr:hypothetical protein [Nostoc sp. XA013]
PEAIPVYLLLSNRVNSLRLIPLVSSLIDTYWLLVCDRPVIDYPKQNNAIATPSTTSLRYYRRRLRSQ